MAYKKCPRCELNWISDEEDYCEVCKKELSVGGYAPKIDYNSPFPMNIVITTERGYIEAFDGNAGMEGYILKGENGVEYGVAFHTYEGTDREQDRVEIRYNNDLTERYGFWHRLNLGTGEFKWSFLQRILKEQGIFKGFVF